MLTLLWRIVRNLVLLFLALIVVVFVLSILPRQFFPLALDCTDSTIDIYVVNHGYHTGIIIKRGTPEFEWLDAFDAPPGIDYFEIAWGDRDFYMARGEDAWLGLKALLTPTDAVMHVVGLPAGDPIELFGGGQVKKAQICLSRCDNLSEFIHGSFKQHPAQSSILDKGLYGSWSAFYDAVGTYSIVYTCNSWTAEALDIAGIATPIWGGTAQSVMYHLPEKASEQ